MTGWIKLYRQMTDWQWYQDKNVKVVFLHLLLKANIEDKVWRNVPVKRGELIISPKRLGEALDLSYHQVRSTLTRLKNSGEITTTSTNKYTHIFINNFDKYQNVNSIADVPLSTQTGEQTHTPATNKQRANTKQTATTKEEQEYKNVSIKEDKNDSFNTAFDDFWQAYQPVSVDGSFVAKGSKKTTKEKLIKILKSGENYETIQHGLQCYLNYCQANGIKSCGAIVFLNQQRWLDDWTTEPVGNSVARGQHTNAHNKVQSVLEVLHHYQS